CQSTSLHLSVFHGPGVHRHLLSFPTRRSSDLRWFWHWDPAFLRHGDEPTRQADSVRRYERARDAAAAITVPTTLVRGQQSNVVRSEEHTSELQSRENLVCRLLLEKKKNELIRM